VLESKTKLQCDTQSIKVCNSIQPDHIFGMKAFLLVVVHLAFGRLPKYSLPLLSREQIEETIHSYHDTAKDQSLSCLPTLVSPLRKRIPFQIGIQSEHPSLLVSRPKRIMFAARTHCRLLRAPSFQCYDEWPSYTNGDFLINTLRMHRATLRGNIIPAYLLHLYTPLFAHTHKYYNIYCTNS